MYKSLIFLLAVFTTACQSAEELKTEQYFAEGYQIYTANCANCHQTDGKGMANLYPPLAGSAALKDKALLACIIKNGMKGDVLADGKKFNRKMPANPKLMDLEIAEIITYVNMKWNKDSVYTTTEFVHKTLSECKAEL
ncbi:cytochrome c [Dyadobacter sp. NIV53]|uniref:c-type cytochrome n=1 Tax=Dyadobacter sp. NIV53 TaxID=2861765 RepID=UPI001C877850|nr:cytochrome c [Dyadobacter sp. NIV53]